MTMMRSTTRAGLGLVVLALAACSDGTSPAAPEPTVPGPVQLVQLACRASVEEMSVRCGSGSLTGDARGLIVGNQDVYVRLTSSSPAYNAATQAFTFNVTVQNLIAQPLGTANGTTPSPTGVRVFFPQDPTVASGSGAIAVVADGTGTFTAGGQSYYQYSGTQLGADGILSPNETSAAKGWTFTVPTTVNTFVFTLYVAADVPAPNGYVDVTPPADTVLAGQAQALTATVRDAVGTPLAGETVTWGTSNGGVATVDPSGNVTAVAPGTVVITATSGTRAGSATLAVCPNLAVGGAYVATASTFCLGTGSAAAEYTVVPTALAMSGSLSYSITGNGITAVAGVPTPDLLPAPGARAIAVRGQKPDEARHLRMLGEQRRQAGLLGNPSLVRGRAAGARRNITTGVPAVGAVMNLNVSDFYCTPVDVRAATVRAVGTHIIILEDNANPAARPTAADYQEIAATFDTLVYPAVAGNFGAPFDIDENGRVIALYTAAVNDMSDPGSGSYVGGFFYSRDMFSTASCAGSNQGEMFYLLAADPTGSHGIDWSVAEIKEQTVGVLGHEFEHLINSSRRLYESEAQAEFETVWLDEGLAHVAEELIYYAASGRAPGQNLAAAQAFANAAQQDAFLRYAESNFGRLREWLRTPTSTGPFRSNDALSTRGATWSFLRYAADRKGGPETPLWNGLAIGPDTGVVNVAAALGTDPKPWLRDWAASMYADDAGIGATSPYTQPSWNFRDIYGNLNYGTGFGYPLAARNPTNGVAQAFTLSRGGGSAYVRMGVPAGGFAGVTSTAPGANLGVVVVRRK